MVTIAKQIHNNSQDILEVKKQAAQHSELVKFEYDPLKRIDRFYFKDGSVLKISSVKE